MIVSILRFMYKQRVVMRADVPSIDFSLTKKRLNTAFDAFAAIHLS